MESEQTKQKTIEEKSVSEQQVMLYALNGIKRYLEERLERVNEAIKIVDKLDDKEVKAIKTVTELLIDEIKTKGLF